MVVPTFMEVLDTTIANVALRYIAGGLSAAVVDSEWVITSYLAANAIILPISGWLSARLGRRNYFLLSIAVFTIASALCGMATSLGQIILFRVIQGLAGGGLQPSSQAILLDSFPPEKQGAAMTLFGIAALIGARRRPDAGRLSLVNYRTGAGSSTSTSRSAASRLLMSYFLVEDPDYLKQERAELRRKPLNFDYIGLGLLALVMSAGKSCSARARSGTGWATRSGGCRRCCCCSCWGGACLVCLGDADRQPGRQFPAAGRAQLLRCPASSFFARLPCCTPPARRCRACSSRCLATTPIARGW